ncbi:9357_t:CDS:2, partial [Acaulospora morrowiae]
DHLDMDNEWLYLEEMQGSPPWGLDFWNLDQSVKYGYSTKTSFWWNLNTREIFVNPSAPFPPILPSIYTVCYGYVLRSSDNRGGQTK